jgi:hypothetical protein
MRDGLAAGDRVQLHINNGKKKAYTRNGLDWIKRFSVGRSAAFCQGRVKSASGGTFETSRGLVWMSGRKRKSIGHPQTVANGPTTDFGSGNSDRDIHVVSRIDPVHSTG